MNIHSTANTEQASPSVMTDPWKQWDQDLAIMNAITSCAEHINGYAIKMQALAQRLPKVPPPAVGPEADVRLAAEQLAVAHALMKAVIDQYSGVFDGVGQ